LGSLDPTINFPQHVSCVVARGWRAFFCCFCFFLERLSVISALRWEEHDSGVWRTLC
jgi:hypothetical protein